jgi:hypothetical protein
LSFDDLVNWGDGGSYSMSERRLWPLPVWWYVTLIVAVVVAIVLIACNPPFPLAISRVFSKHVRPDRWSIAVGLVVLAIVLSHLAGAVARYVLAALLRLTGDTTAADAWSPAVVGVCESVLYPASLLLNKPEFIGVWLAIKVAGQWARWSGDRVEGAPSDLDALNQGRRRFNAFLVGNAISIGFGVFVWLCFKVVVLVPRH